MALETGNSLHWKTSIDNSELRSGARDATGIIANMAANISRINPFAVIGVAAAAAFGKASTEATRFSVSVTEAMKEVETISRAVHGNFKFYTNAIVDMSREIPESAEQLTKAYYQVVSAGYDGAAGLELLETAARAAVAGVTDTFTAVDGLTTVLNAFKLEAEDATYASDVMFTTVRLGKTTFEELSRELAYVAPIAAATGIAFEEVFAAMASLTKQSMDTSMAARYLRGAIVQMNEALGDGWQEAMTLQEAMQKLYEMADGSQTKLAELVASIEARNAILALTGKNAADAASDLKEFEDVTGATADAVEIMQDKLSEQATLLKNNMLAALKPIGDGIQDFLIDRFKEANRVLGIMIERQREYNEEYALSKLSQLETLITGPAQDVDWNAAMAGVYRTTGGAQTVEERAQLIRDMGVEIENLEEKLTLYDQLKTAYTGAAERQKILNEITDAARDVFFGVSQDADDAADSVERFNAAIEGAVAAEPGDTRSYEERNRYKLQEMERLIEREKRLAEQYETLPEQFTRSDEWQQDYAARMALIAEREAERNRRATFENMFQDFRRLNERELREYETFLQDKLELDQWNADEKIALLERLDQVQAEIYDREIENVREVGNAISELGNILDTMGAKTDGIFQKAGNIIGEVADLKESTGWASTVGGVLGIATNFVGIITNALSTSSQEPDYVVQIEKINTALEDQIDLLNTLSGMERLTAQQNIVTTLRREVKAYEDAIATVTAGYQEAIADVQRDLEATAGAPEWSEEGQGRDALERQLEGLRSQQEGKVAGLSEQLKDARNELAGFEQDYQRMLLGTTADSLADGILDGFRQGESAIDIFADTFEDTMSNAMLNLFKQDMITEFLQPWLDLYQKLYRKGGGLSEVDQIVLHDELMYIAEQVDAAWEDVNEFLGGAGIDLFENAGERTATGLSGQIRQSVTEDTAGLIEGQMRGMRMDMGDMLDYMDRNLTAVQRIRDNTEFNRQFLPKLASIDRKLDTGMNIRALGG